MEQVQEFVEMLRDPNPGVRKFALQRLSEVGDREIIPLLHQAANDPDDSVAIQAERSLQVVLRRSGTGPRSRRAKDPRVIPFGNLHNVKGEARLARLRLAGLEVLAPCTRKLAEFLLVGRQRLARASAVALGKVGDPATIPELTRALEGDAASHEAAVALAGIDDPGVVDVLVRLLRTSDKRLVRLTLYALDSLKDDRITEVLLDLTRHPDPEIRADVVFLLGELGNSSIVGSIRQMLNDDDEHVVVRGIDALRKLNDQTILDEVGARFLAASHERVRATLLMCLLHHPLDDRVIELLATALRDPDARVRANAVDAVGSLKAAAATKLRLLEPVMEDPNNRVLGNVAVALGPVDTVAALTVLTRLLNSSNKWERASAVYAAGFIRETKVGFCLANALSLEEDEDVIRNLVSSLARFKDRALLEHVQGGLKHSRANIRFATARIVGQVRDRHARRSLSDALDREPDATVRAEMISALSRLSDTSQIPHLARFLSDPDPRVQANALDGLERLGSLEIIPYVRPLLQSLDNRVKANAAKALFGQGDLDVVRDLSQMLASAEDSERLSAVFALGEIGLALHSLSDTHRYYLLASALEERASAGVGTADRKPFSLSDAIRVHQFTEEHWDLVSAYLKGDHPEALTLADALLREHPSHPIGQFIKGEIHRGRADYERASAHLEVSEAYDGGFLGVLVSLANLYNSKGQTRESIVYYLKTLREKLALYSQEVEFALGLVKSDRLGDASLLLKSLVSQVPLDPRTHYQVGCQAVRYGDPKKAFHHLFLAYLSDPQDVEACLELIRVCRQLDFASLAAKLTDLVGGILETDDPRRVALAELEIPGRECLPS